MTTTWILLTASLLLAPAQPAETGIPACGVELQLRARAEVLEVEHQQLDTWHGLEVELVNVSDRAVTLVMPGDGSSVAWRTPILRWSVSPAPETPQMVRCGNINHLRPGEVFTLAPGERRRLREWVPPVFGVTSGTYTLRLSYINDPALKWRGVELGPHDPAEMQRVRASTPCRVVSNDLQIAVVSKPANTNRQH